VPFSHQRHAAALGLVCLDCHAPGRFELRRGGTPGVTMAAMTRGTACGACHNSQRTFGLRDAALCARCHRPS
jgi:c(7)-type cytochrome triheme protein